MSILRQRAVRRQENAQQMLERMDPLAAIDYREWGRRARLDGDATPGVAPSFIGPNESVTGQ